MEQTFAILGKAVKIMIDENDTLRNISQKALLQNGNGDISNYWITFGDYHYYGDKPFKEYLSKNKNGVVFLDEKILSSYKNPTLSDVKRWWQIWK